MSFQVGIGSLGGTLFHSANHVIFILVYCYRRAQILREGERKSTRLTLGEWKILLGVDFFYQGQPSEEEYIWPFKPFSK